MKFMRQRKNSGDILRTSIINKERLIGSEICPNSYRLSSLIIFAAGSFC